MSRGTLGRYRSTLFAGLLGGGGAFVAGFVATGLFFEFKEVPELGFGTEEWRVVAWYFYNAHFVGLDGTFSGFGGSARLVEDVNLIARSNDPQLQFLYLIPPLTVLVAGFLVASSSGRASEASLAAFDGAHVVVGYLPLSLLGAYVTSDEASGFGITARVGPEYFDTILLMGIVVPVVAGGVGGLVYYFARR